MVASWLALLGTALPVAFAADYALPPLHYSPAHSVRGANLSSYTLTSSASLLPGIHDFFRLVPSVPLAFGTSFTETPWPSTEFVVEIGFRVHGAELPGDESVSTKGGRGLAFWYARDRPQFSTMYSAKSNIPQQPPPHPYPMPKDDQQTALFGHSTHFGFDGLAVVFDSSPSSPLFTRSDRRSMISDEAHGAEHNGVVSGLLDDGMKRDWLDTDTMEERRRKNGLGVNPGEGQVPKEEASYLSSAFGECEAAFRNAQGLLWARIINHNGTIRVDLDLSPHTTLSSESRSYAHNCFEITGVEIDSGRYFGLSALASGNSEPDVVDIYAMDVWEITKQVVGQAPVEAVSDAPLVVNKKILEGLSDDPVTDLTHELFLSQAKMMEAIDSLGRRVELLSDSVSSGSPSGSAGDSSMKDRLTSIDQKLIQLLNIPRNPVPTTNDGTENLSQSQVIQLLERLMAELKAFSRKLETTNGQQTATLSTISSRATESLNLIRTAISLLESPLSSSSFLTSILSSKLTWGLLGFGLLLMGIYSFVSAKRGGYEWGSQFTNGGRGKKMI